MKGSVKGLSAFALIMLITGSIDSIRNLPATAMFGSALIFFFILSALVFLIPTGLISAELSSTYTKSEQGGIYGWVKMAFGEQVGFMAIWLQWINTMVWYPTILSFIAGTAAFLIDPALAQNKLYLVSIILGVFWTLTLFNLKGIRASSRFVTVCTLIGFAAPMLLIVGLAIVWVVSGKPLQVHLSVHHLIPNLGNKDIWISLTAIMAAFLGMELATVHVKQVDDPRRTFPKAMLISVLLVLLTMMFGSLAIAVVLPHDKISLVDGVMQAFQGFFQVYHLSGLIPVLTVMLLVGSLGSMINWIISPAKGLLQAARDGYMPQYLQKENKHGVPSRLLIVQAILVSFVCLAFLLMPSVNGSYWLLTDLSTQLYMFMYVFMFLAALRLRYKYPDKKRPFQIPGGRFGLWVACLFGLMGTAITVVVGFFPPANIDVGGFWHYETVFSAGILLMTLPVIGFYIYRAKAVSHSSVDIPEQSHGVIPE